MRAQLQRLGAWRLLLLLACALAAAPEASALDCPHCPGGAASPNNEPSYAFPTGGGCNTCHVAHAGPWGNGTVTFNSVNALCESCHNDTTATAVNTHGAEANTSGTTNCSFCRLSFSVTCTDCHEPHSHEQSTYDDPSDPDEGVGDHFLRTSVRVTSTSGDCNTDCPGGQYNDPSEQGSCKSSTPANIPNCGDKLCTYGTACDSSQGEPVCVCPPNLQPNVQQTDMCAVCATGYTGTPPNCVPDTSVCGTTCANGHGTCQSGSGQAEFQICSNAGNDATKCGSVTCGGGGGWLPGNVVGSGCAGARQGNNDPDVTVTYDQAFTTDSPTTTAIQLWLRLVYDSDGPTYSCTLSGVSSGGSFNVTPADFPAECQALANSLCWVEAPGAQVLNSSSHALSCTVTTAAKNSYVGYDGIIFEADPAYTNPDDPATAPSCTDTQFSAGSCPGVNWGPNQSYSTGGTTCVCSGNGYQNCVSCATGYTGRGGDCVADCTTSNPCTAGTCYVDSAGAAVCDCTGTYYGTNCLSCNAGASSSMVAIATASSPTDFTKSSGTPGLCQGCHTSTTHFKDDFSDVATHENAPVGTNCMNCHKHTTTENTTGYGFIPDEQSQSCAGCHLATSGTGTQDVDSFAWDGTKALIDIDEWTGAGHGRSTTFPTPAMPGKTVSPGTVLNSKNYLGDRGCLYCHDRRVGHNVPGNYFRLANTGWNGKGANGTCLVCHGDGATGYDPDVQFGSGNNYGAAVTATKIVENAEGDPAYHQGGGHAPTNPDGHNGGQFCWDCHDPHGDTAGSDSTGTTFNYYMIQRRPTEHSDAGGLPTTPQADPVDFLPGNDSTATSWSYDDLKLPVSATPNVAKGLCRACHHSGTGAVNHHLKDEASDDGHPGPTLNPPAGETCTTQCHPHEKGLATQAVGGGTCNNCHLASTGSPDTNDYLENGTPAKISVDEWNQSGHGSAGGYLSGNPGAGFNSQKDQGCEYCHTYDGHSHATDNWFVLANRTCTSGWCGGITNGVACTVGTQKTDCRNAPCLVCHMTGAPGFDPDGSGTDFAPRNRTNSAEIDMNHLGSKHGSASPNNSGGTFCWDCHDPHGDNGSSGNPTWYMIHREPFEQHSTTVGKEDQPTSFSVAIDFRQETGGNTSALDSGDYYQLCAKCHDSVVSNYNKTTTSTEHQAHNAPDGQKCTNCHSHNQTPGFATTSNCLDANCHATTAGTRRNVVPDFSKNSHHVGAGGTMGGTLTTRDCIVCHVEGWLNGTEVTINGNYHNNGKIDLRNADSTKNVGDASYVEGTDYWAYDPSVITATKPTNWNSSDANWRTQMETKMDPFCLSCHDSSGAAGAASGGAGHVADATATATNPFDDNINNAYDQQSRGAVVDIKSKVSLDPTPTDYDGDGSNDPPDGVYARHAIRGQAPSRYSTSNANWGDASYWNTTNYPGWTWNETQQMGCADCHTNDGANGTTGNAHGADTEYLLKDGSGAASSETNYVCYLCHSSYYSSTPHAGAKSDYVETVTATGTARTAGNGNIYGFSCGNCHGGGGADVRFGAGKFGTIHGTYQVYPVQGNTCAMGSVDNQAVCRKAYRFTNGNSLRFYDPEGWTGTTSTCYTLTTVDGNWGGCTKHGGSPVQRTKGSASKTVGPAAQRPLSY